MIPVTVMVSGSGTVSYRIKGRFGVGSPSKFSEVFKPIIVWNITYACNLKCIHCYIRAGLAKNNELNTEEALDLIDQIKEIRSPLLILSGGEPLVRKDFNKIFEYASSKDINLVLSTNGVLINKKIAKWLSKLGFKYIGISIDSPNPEWHDKFRGVEGSFKKALEGVKYCVEAGLPTGIRFTVTRYNVEDVPDVINLSLKNGISRITFYHLSSAGRAQKMSRDWFITPEQYEWFMNVLINTSIKYRNAIEIETTMAPFDGIYIADKIAKSRGEFKLLMELVKAQGGCGRKIISIYPDGTVYPCQFVDFMSLGNIRKNRLIDILNPHHPAIDYFTNTEKYLKFGKCSECPFKDICKGGDRIRAYYLGGSLYSSDPQCYLDVNKIYRRWFLS